MVRGEKMAIFGIFCRSQRRTSGASVFWNFRKIDFKRTFAMENGFFFGGELFEILGSFGLCVFGGGFWEDWLSYACRGFCPPHGCRVLPTARVGTVREAKKDENRSDGIHTGSGIFHFSWFWRGRFLLRGLKWPGVLG